MLIKHKGKYYRDNAEITAEKYNEIMELLRKRPTAPDGYGCRLTDSLEWELYELPPAEEGEEDATEEDYLAALAELGVTDEEN